MLHSFCSCCLKMTMFLLLMVTNDQLSRVCWLPAAYILTKRVEEMVTRKLIVEMGMMAILLGRLLLSKLM